jgi:cytochrome d ubiquinol oxidase subunit I
MRNEMVSFAEVALSPFAVSKFCHTITSAWIIGAIFCVGVSCWYLLKKQHTRLAIESMKIGAAVGLVAALLAGATGHKSGMDVAKVQPMKLAAMEALYDGGTEVGLKLVEGIEVPYGLSIMATNDPKGYVPGINDILNGYTDNEGNVEPSVEEKMERGRIAIEALAAYRKAKKEGADEATLSTYLSLLNDNMKYFGYGYIKDKNQVVPPVAVNFWAFRVMVGVGCLFILFFAVILAVVYRWPKFLFGKRDITTLPAWHYWLAIMLIPLGYIGSECGWLVAEFGRQPWTIQDMLPTWASVSDIQASNVAITFFLFLVLFTTMLAVEINILLKQIKRGPASE